MMATKKTKDGALHRGHRERMRSKLIAHGAQVFHTYELLEMLLYSQIRYRDTNDMAKRLFKSFKTTDGVLTRTPDELMTVEGIGPECAAFLSTVGSIDKLLDSPCNNNDSVVIDGFMAGGEYAVRHFGGKTEHEVILLLLDNKLSLIEGFVICNAAYGSAAVKPKDFVNKALQYHASVAIIAFNHPFGPDTATASDHESNKAVKEALDAAGICLAETYCVCGNKYSGLIGTEKYKTFSQCPDMMNFYKGNGWDISALFSSPTACAAGKDTGSSGAPFTCLCKLLSGSNKNGRAQEIARQLFSRHSTLREILSAPADELMRYSDISLSDALLLNIIIYITSRRTTERFVAKRIYSEKETADYLKAVFMGANVEKIYAILLGRSGELKACEFLAAGSVNSSTINPRVLVEYAIKHDAKQVILAHNHPSGSTEPSKEDIVLTVQLKRALSNLGIDITAHYIVAGNDCDKIDMTSREFKIPALI